MEEQTAVLSIRSLSGEAIATVHALLSWSGADLKNAVNKQLGWRGVVDRLLYNSVRITDQSMLAQLGVSSGASLQVTLRKAIFAAQSEIYFRGYSYSAMEYFWEVWLQVQEDCFALDFCFYRANRDFADHSEMGDEPLDETAYGQPVTDGSFARKEGRLTRSDDGAVHFIFQEASPLSLHALEEYVKLLGVARCEWIFDSLAEAHIWRKGGETHLDEWLLESKGKLPLGVMPIDASPRQRDLAALRIQATRRGQLGRRHAQEKQRSLVWEKQRSLAQEKQRSPAQKSQQELSQEALCRTLLERVSQTERDLSISFSERDLLRERLRQAEEESKAAQLALKMKLAEIKAKETVWMQFALAKQRTAACTADKQRELAKREKDAIAHIEQQFANYQDNPSLFMEQESLAKLQTSELSSSGTNRFLPKVSVYDHLDPVLGLRRIIRVEAPGRRLSGDGCTSVTGTVRKLDNGVCIHLRKVSDLPVDVVPVHPFSMPAAPGTWEWNYQPPDGNWQVCNSWGIEHGIFALALQRKSDFTPTPTAEEATPTLPIFGTNFIPASCGGFSVEDKLCATVIATMPDGIDPSLQLHQDALLVNENFELVPARAVTVGSSILGPSGWLQVSDLRSEGGEEVQVAIIAVGDDELPVPVSGAKVLAAASTADGAAAEDWAAHDVRDLRAGTHELVLQAVTGDAEVAAQVTSVRLSSWKGTAVSLSFQQSAVAVFVRPQPCVVLAQAAPRLTMGRRRDLRPDFIKKAAHRTESSPFSRAFLQPEAFFKQAAAHKSDPYDGILRRNVPQSAKNKTFV